MKPEIGDVLQGTVTGIAKFGAFVASASGVSGLVHISEISDSFVQDVSEYLSVGQSVSVKVIGISNIGKISFSIKACRGLSPVLTPSPEPVATPLQDKTPSESSFEDKLKRFMQDSESKISDLRKNTDRHSSGRRH